MLSIQLGTSDLSPNQMNESDNETDRISHQNPDRGLTNGSYRISIGFCKIRSDSNTRGPLVGPLPGF